MKKTYINIYDKEPELVLHLDELKKLKDKIDKTESTTTYLINGPRGSGKTTFLNALYKSTNGVEYIYIDPSVIPTNSHPIFDILFAVAEANNESDEVCEMISSFTEAYAPALLTLNNNRINTYEEFTEPTFAVLELYNSSKNSKKLRASFFELVYKIFKDKVVTFLIDDIDTDLKNGFKVLELIRTLTQDTPCNNSGKATYKINFVLAGDIKQFRMLIRKEKELEFFYNTPEKELTKNQLKQIIELTNQYLIKLFKEENIVNLTPPSTHFKNMSNISISGEGDPKDIHEFLNIDKKLPNFPINELYHEIASKSMRELIQLMTIIDNFNTTDTEQRLISTIPNVTTETKELIIKVIYEQNYLNMEKYFLITKRLNKVPSNLNRQLQRYLSSKYQKKSEAHFLFTNILSGTLNLVFSSNNFFEYHNEYIKLISQNSIDIIKTPSAWLKNEENNSNIIKNIGKDIYKGTVSLEKIKKISDENSDKKKISKSKIGAIDFSKIVDIQEENIFASELLRNIKTYTRDEKIALELNNLLFKEFTNFSYEEADNIDDELTLDITSLTESRTPVTPGEPLSRFISKYLLQFLAYSLKKSSTINTLPHAYTPQEFNKRLDTFFQYKFFSKLLCSRSVFPYLHPLIQIEIKERDVRKSNLSWLSEFEDQLNIFSKLYQNVLIR